MKLSAISNSFSLTPKVKFISQKDTEHGYSESEQMVGIRRKEILEEEVILEAVMATKELRKTKVSFDTYSVPKAVVGGVFKLLFMCNKRKGMISRKKGILQKWNTDNKSEYPLRGKSNNSVSRDEKDCVQGVCHPVSWGNSDTWAEDGRGTPACNEIIGNSEVQKPPKSFKNSQGQKGGSGF